MALFTEFEHLVDSGLKLKVASRQLHLGSVIYLYIGLQFLIFKEIAVHVAATYLRYAKHYARINLGLPPHGCHSTGHRSAYKFTYAESLVDPRKSVRIGVIVFANKHARGLQPFVEGVRTNVLPARGKLRILLAAEQCGKVIVQPTATIMTCVDYHSLAIAIAAELVGVYLAETRAVHALDMHISDLSTRKFLYLPTVVFNPAAIQE